MSAAHRNNWTTDFLRIQAHRIIISTLTLKCSFSKEFSYIRWHFTTLYSQNQLRKDFPGLNCCQRKQNILLFILVQIRVFLKVFTRVFWQDIWIKSFLCKARKQLVSNGQWQRVDLTVAFIVWVLYVRVRLHHYNTCWSLCNARSTKILE